MKLQPRMTVFPKLLAVALGAAMAGAVCCRSHGSSGTERVAKPRLSPGFKSALDPGHPNRVPNEYILTLRDAGCLPRALTLLARFGGQKKGSIGNNMHLFRLNTDPGPKAVERAVSGDACVKAAQPNFRYRAL